MDINKENLDKALSSADSQGQSGQGQPQGANGRGQGGQEQNMSQEEEAGFHKGALNTLVNERNELLKMAQNVETVMQQHIKRLQELGVNVQGSEGQGNQQGQGRQQ
ncbi:MAG: hypothetical protein ABEI74_01855 [Candidatus Pacearchaeota archaeon]